MDNVSAVKPQPSSAQERESQMIFISLNLLYFVHILRPKQRVGEKYDITVFLYVYIFYIFSVAELYHNTEFIVISINHSIGKQKYKHPVISYFSPTLCFGSKICFASK